MLGVNIRKLNLLRGMANREFVGMDFNSDNLKLAHTKVYPKKIEVVDLLSQNISGMADEDISRTIRSTFDGLKVNKPDIVNIVPAHLVITKNIEVPSTDPKEIKEIINLQAGRHTPFSREEIIIDYIDIGTYKHSYTKVLLVIVARNVIKRQFEILDRAGLRLDKIFLAPEGIAWCVPRISNIKTETLPVNAIHIDDTFTDFTIVFKGKVIFVRSIPLGVRQLIDEREKYQLKFVEEIKSSLEAYQNEDIETNPNAIMLTGAIEELKGLEAILNDALHIPIETVSYFKGLLISDEALKAAGMARRLSFLNVIAPLFAWQELKVSLIPEEIKLKKSIEQRGRDLIKIGIFILTAIVLVSSILISKIYFKGLYLKKLDTEYKSLNQEGQIFEKDFQKVSLVRDYLSRRGLSLEVLTELHDIIPIELELNDIRFDEQGRLFLKGTAESMSSVFSFVEDMENSEYFNDVKTKYTSKRRVGLRDVADFEINCFVNKELQ